MELTQYIKLKINEILKKYPVDYIRYSDFTDLLKRTNFKIEDILVYLIKVLDNELNKDSINMTMFHKLVKSIDIILSISSHDYILMSKDTTDKLYRLLSTNQEKQNDKEVEKLLNLLKDSFFISYPQYQLETPEEEKIDVSVIEKLKVELEQSKIKISQLEEKNNNLELKVQKQEKDYMKLKDAEQELKRIKNNLEMSINKLKEENKEKKHEIMSLIDKSKEYQEQIEFIQNMLNELEKNYQLEICKNEEITISKIELDQIILRQTKIIEELQLKIKNDEQKVLEQKNKEEKIKELLLTKLYQNSRVDIKYIIKCLSLMGIETTPKEIHEYLMNLKQTINIEGPLLDTIPPSYRIDKTPLIIESPFNYTIGTKKELELIFVSDMHISNNTSLEKLKLQQDLLYNYGTNHNIETIFNLGDTFFSSYHNGKNMDRLNNIEEIIHKFLVSVPENTGIYHALLGGNHDEELLPLGVDPLKRLAESRFDMIHLGYRHRLIQLENEQNKLMLLHPNCRFLEDNYFCDNLKNYFNGIYQNMNRDEVYCDFLGHTHKSILDTAHSYCMLPSYSKDRVTNGCYHVKIYFDENKNIDYMLLIPLITIEGINKLIPTSEIVYQKIRKK